MRGKSHLPIRGAGSTGRCNTICYKSFFYKVVFVRQRRRIKLSANQRNDMWSRWKTGQSLHEIGRAFSKDHVSIQFMLAQHGGIAPAARRRSPLTLTLAERENISRGIACGWAIREKSKRVARGGGGGGRGGRAAMAGDLSIERVTPTRKLGSRPCGPSGAFLPST